jgi:hypothetical protein
MKRFTVFFAAILMFAAVAIAQNPFQGTIKYEFKFMGEGIEAFQAMMPTGMELNVLKSDISTEIQGGMVAMMMGRTISKTKKGISYMIKESEETIYVMDPKKMKNEEEEVAEEPVVTKEDEVINIAGYECQKYKVVQGENTTYVWATDKFVLPKGESSGGGGMSGMVNMKGVSGTPLKVSTMQQGLSVNIIAKEVSTTPPAKSMFKLPKGYAKEDFDAEKMMGGMGGM